MVRGSNSGGDEIFRTRPDRHWGPPSFLYNVYGVSFPGVKQPGRGVDHPPSSSAEVKERVELNIYSLSGPSWPITECALLYFCISFQAKKQNFRRENPLPSSGKKSRRSTCFGEPVINRYCGSLDLNLSQRKMAEMSVTPLTMCRLLNVLQLNHVFSCVKTKKKTRL